MNKESSKLLHLAYIFEDYFDFRERRPKDFIKETSIKTYQTALFMG